MVIETVTGSKIGFHSGFSWKNFSLVLGSGYITFDVNEKSYGGIWFTWLGFEFAMCNEFVEV